MEMAQLSEIERLKERVSNLEITQAFQDDTVESLQRTVALQHQEIQTLQQQLTLLSEYLKSMKQGGDIKRPSEEQPPPHY